MESCVLWRNNDEIQPGERPPERVMLNYAPFNLEEPLSRSELKAVFSVECTGVKADGGTARILVGVGTSRRACHGVMFFPMFLLPSK